jgi:hypothetical protein
LAWKKILLADHLKSIEGVADDRLPVFFVDVAIRKRQLEVFKDCLIVEQVIALKNKSNVPVAHRGALFSVQGVNRCFFEIVLTAPRLIVHAQDMEQR